MCCHLVGMNSWRMFTSSVIAIFCSVSMLGFTLLVHHIDTLAGSLSISPTFWRSSSVQPTRP